jgi:hypothetical protein
MLERLKRRAAKAGLLNRLDARLASPDSMALYRLGRLRRLYPRLCRSRRIPRCSRVLSSDRGGFQIKGFAFAGGAPGYVESTKFESELAAAHESGFGLPSRPSVPRSHTAFLHVFRVGAVSSSLALALRSRAWHAPESRESSQSSPNRATLESRLSAPSSLPRLQDA